MIEILGAARDPGLRAKISVKSNDPKLDAMTSRFRRLKAPTESDYVYE